MRDFHKATLRLVSALQTSALQVKQIDLVEDGLVTILRLQTVDLL